MKASKVAFYGILIALAMALSYLEAQIPPIAGGIPGIKLGLTNVVVLFALYKMGYKSAILVNVLRILLVGFMFSNGYSIIYSMAGGLLSGLVMILLKRFTKLAMVTVSIAGGLAHNVGQILVAMVMLQTQAIAWYLIILWFSGIVSGVLVGLLGAELTKRVKLNF